MVKKMYRWNRMPMYTDNACFNKWCFLLSFINFVLGKMFCTSPVNFLLMRWLKHRIGFYIFIDLFGAESGLNHRALSKNTKNFVAANHRVRCQLIHANNTEEKPTLKQIKAPEDLAFRHRHTEALDSGEEWSSVKCIRQLKWTIKNVRWKSPKIL